MSVNSLGHIDRLDRVHSFVWERIFLQRTQAFHSSVLPALPDRLSAPANSSLVLREGRWEDFWDFLLYLTGRCKGNCSKSSLLTFRLMFCLPMSVGNVFFSLWKYFQMEKKNTGYWDSLEKLKIYAWKKFCSYYLKTLKTVNTYLHICIHMLLNKIRTFSEKQNWWFADLTIGIVCSSVCTYFGGLTEF